MGRGNLIVGLVTICLLLIIPNLVDTGPARGLMDPKRVMFDSFLLTHSRPVSIVSNVLQLQFPFP